MIRELAAEEVRKKFDPASLEFETTAEGEVLKGIVGQPRAVSALSFGLGISDAGFNIFVSGPRGIGKMTAVESFLGAIARSKPTPPDWCYVNNFVDPYQPSILRLPAGRGRELQQDIKELIADARREIPKAFESEAYSTKRDEIRGGLDKEREDLLNRFGQRALQAGFAVEPTPFGIAMIPLKAGRPLNEKEFAALPQAEREAIQKRHSELQEELNELLKKARALERTARERVQALDQQVTLYVVGGLVDDLTEKYRDLPQVVEFLAAVRKDILENAELFKSPPGAATAATGEIPIPLPWLQEQVFRKYEVNVLVDNSSQTGAPVVVELNPSYANLVGRIEKETRLGALYTDHTMIKAGSLHRANGGYLVLQAQDVLTNPYSWEALKRALRARSVEIEDLGDRLGLLTTKSLRPTPMPLEVKVVLVGRPLLYALLHTYDEDFSELFKVKADFDTRMKLSTENVADFVAFIRMLCEKEGLLHLDRSAAALLLEEALRLAADQESLSTHFGAVADILRESNYWALQSNAAVIKEEHVRKALEARVYRASLIKERIQELIARGQLVIKTSGTAVGQVNGLSLMVAGDYTFGRPNRITASVAPGREGIIDIERQVALGGPIHSKGVLILSGYLAQTYARDIPLSLAARLVFEQSYEGVEGDSASSAELYALLSALSGLPIKQSIAVTGSVDQMGNVQAIGGVNEKIEGFFEACLATELTGDQGVMIPAANSRDLMLRPDIVDAVRMGKFHIWVVDNVQDGIELLTGVPAGQRNEQEEYAPETVNGRVTRCLFDFALTLRRFAEAPPEAKSQLAGVVQQPTSN